MQEHPKSRQTDRHRRNHDGPRGDGPQRLFVTHRARTAVSLVVLAMGLLAAGCGQDTAADPAPHPVPGEASTVAVRPTTPVDEHVAVHGAALHVSCAGSGDVTVVLISGFGDGADSWSAVAPEVSRGTRVCTHERFGDGTSDAPPATQTFATEADDLRAALRSINEPGPFLAVGHSFGGAEAVTFAARFPTEVAGLVLVDASPATWQSTICGVLDDGSPAALGFQELCATVSSPENNPERLDGRAAFADVARIGSIGDIPMIVTTAAQHSYPGLAAGEEARLDRAWTAGQQHWASLSSASQLVTVDDTSHYIQLDRPDIVVDQIQQLLP